MKPVMAELDAWSVAGSYEQDKMFHSQANLRPCVTARTQTKELQLLPLSGLELQREDRQNHLVRLSDDHGDQAHIKQKQQEQQDPQHRRLRACT